MALDLLIGLFVLLVVVRGARTGLLAGVFSLWFVVVWAIGVFALRSSPLPGAYPAVKESRILQLLDERMPSELLTRAVAELNPLPQIRGPEADVANPAGRLARDPEVLAAGSRTV